MNSVFSFAVIAQGCASCPEIWCQAPLCGKAFCYHCKAAWHPNQTCDAARRQRAPPTNPVPPPPQPHHSPTESEHTGLIIILINMLVYVNFFVYFFQAFLNILILMLIFNIPSINRFGEALSTLCSINRQNRRWLM